MPLLYLIVEPVFYLEKNTREIHFLGDICLCLLLLLKIVKSLTNYTNWIL